MVSWLKGLICWIILHDDSEIPWQDSDTKEETIVSMCARCERVKW